MPDHNKLAREIHEDNIKAGWWKQNKIHDTESGETGFITIPRNIGELLCLVHSEMSEAYEGYKLGLKDDHLPEYPMFQVELGDTCIRLYDILGYYRHDCEMPSTTLFNEALTVPTLLLEFHLRVSEAMEHFRKGRDVKGCEKLCTALFLVWLIAAKNNVPLEIIIEAKREYNRNRLDHKIEVREAEGGKKF